MGKGKKRSKGKKKKKKGPEEEELEEGWVRCPKCDHKVKEDNLRRHLQKVHGLSKSQAMKAAGEDGGKRPKRRKGTSLTVPIAAICVVVIILVAGWFAYDHFKEEETSPELYIDRTDHDFGDIQPESVTTTFSIANDGDGVLVIKDIETTCDCTQAQLNIGGVMSPVFKQNYNPDYKGKIEPGESATLMVTYDPNRFGDSGPVTRYVQFGTNDDDNDAVTLTIVANVQV